MLKNFFARNGSQPRGTSQDRERERRFLRTLSEENRQLLTRKANQNPLGVYVLAIEGFFELFHPEHPETGFSILDTLEEVAQEETARILGAKCVLFTERIGLSRVLVVVEPSRSAPLSSSCLDEVGTNAPLLRLAVHEAMHARTNASGMGFADDDATANDATGAGGRPHVKLVLGHALLPTSNPGELGYTLLNACWEAEMRAHAAQTCREGQSRFLASILEDKQIETRFQGVVDFSTGKILGWEALSRIMAGGDYHSFTSLVSEACDTETLTAFDRLCRETALMQIARSDTAIHNRKLFLNIHPESLRLDLTPEQLVRRLAESGLSPKNLVLELSDRHRVRDVNLLVTTLESFRAEGFRIALDEVGAESTNLRFISQLRPDYLKVDISLIGGIDTNPYNRLMLETLAAMAARMEARLIAVGVETETEFSFLVSMGVAAGQGNFLAPPARALTDECVLIPRPATVDEARAVGWRSSTPIRELVRPGMVVQPSTSVRQIKEMLADKPPMGSVMIADKDYRPLGLLMKYTLDRQLSSQFGIALYIERPVSKVMDRDMLVVDAESPVEDVAREAMQRKSEKIYDDIIVLDKGLVLGTVSVQHMLDSLANLKVEMAKGANPLSGLPGNVAIESEIESRVAQGRESSLVYVDLDNFKVYNDVYGFDNGDRVILLTASVLRQALNEYGGEGEQGMEDLLGHVGGDDFIIITEPERAEAVTKRSLELFGAQIGELYDEEDRERGYIEGVGRDGKMGRFGLASLSIGILDCSFGPGFSMGQLSHAVAKVKKDAKAISGNSFARQSYAT